MNEGKLLNDTFCLAPWVHSTCYTQKERQPCCASLEDLGDRLSFEDYWNGDKMLQFRKKMLSGEVIPSCENCYNTPSLHSYKTHFNTLFSHKLNDVINNTDENGRYNGLPISVDYRNSLCNLRCRMCGETASTSIRADYVKLQKYSNPEKILSTEELKQLEIDQLNELLYFIDNSEIEEMYWAGGEPLFNLNHYKVLEKLIEVGKTDLLLRYNTNLTHIKFKNYSFTELITNFDNVHFYFSQDGIGEVAEYVRYGVNFESWEKNFDTILSIKKPNWQFMFHSVVNILNLLEIEKVLEFVDRKENVIVNFFKCHVDEFKNLLGLEFYPPHIIKSIIEDKIGLITKFKDTINKKITLDYLNKINNEFEQIIVDDVNQQYNAFTYINDMDKIRPYNKNFYEMIKSRENRLYEYLKEINNKLYYMEDKIISPFKEGLLNSKLFKL